MTDPDNARQIAQKILLLQNSRSGRGGGRNEGVRAKILAALREAGHEVRVLNAGPALSPQELESAARTSTAVVVAGGDGTLHYALPPLIKSGAPVYHAPMGTENLFARHLGMSREPGALLRAVVGGRIEAMDVGELNERPFAIMVGVGFDGAVVRRVAAARQQGVHRLDYLRSAFAELRSLRPARLRISVDGRRVINNESGQLIVANSPSYAAGLNPARKATMTDGLLDVVFLPYRSAAGVGRTLLAALAAAAARRPVGVIARGARIEVHSDDLAHCQVDGEAVEPLGQPLELEILAKPRALRVLLPT